MDLHLLSTQNTSEVRDFRIQPGNTILLRVPNGDIRSVKVDKDSYGVSMLFPYDFTKIGLAPLHWEDLGHSLRIVCCMSHMD
jgi:hypothetical protein